MSLGFSTLFEMWDWAWHPDNSFFVAVNETTACLWVDSSLGDSHAPATISLQTKAITKILKLCILEDEISFELGCKWGGHS